MLSRKPLKILTIDGGGLQAISTLLILDKLLDTIAQNNRVSHRKPRPCDVFDTIAGIGAGGWLAILLGRFHMDITTCLSEWYKITQRIAPQSMGEGLRMRAMKHCYFHPKRLVQQINTLTKLYDTGDLLFDNRAGEVRTRHVFVAALRSDTNGYNLFRTYEIPTDAALPRSLLEGPTDAAQFKISSAFGVTGAAKYFPSPWSERMSQSEHIRFNDNKFPNPHNITELALDEMWAIYGLEVEISIVVNIGPGLPSSHDIQQIARRFSWGLSSPLNAAFYSKRSGSPVAEAQMPSKKRTNTDPPEESSAGVPCVRFFHTQEQESTTVPVKMLPRCDTLGSIRGHAVDKKLKRREAEIEIDIEDKLLQIYGEKGKHLYYRLAPVQTPEGTARNDSSAPGVALDATIEYLGQAHTVNKIDEIAGHMVSVEC